MQITFLTRKSAMIYRRDLRQRVASLTLNCNGVLAIRAYTRGFQLVDHQCMYFRDNPFNSNTCCLQLVDHRVEFTKWWVTEFKTVKFPSQGTVFDYFIDSETKKFEPWVKKVEAFVLDPDVPLQVRYYWHCLLFLDQTI